MRKILHQNQRRDYLRMVGEMYSLWKREWDWAWEWDWEWGLKLE